jgi:adenylate cyclase
MMEKDLAIMIADLSGYTAHTEVHGSILSADLIDKYLQIVEESLVGDSCLHERTGDEVMIVSEVPDYLLSTALLLLKNTTKENNFLLLHGGLHFGKILKRNNAYFGSALNFTARIAAKANGGSFWCSKEFHDSIKNKECYQFEPRGSYKFKNITEEKEVLEIIADKTSLLAIDPVCRMLILSEDTAIRHPVCNDIFFCSETCLAIYNETMKEPGAKNQ